VPLVRPPRKLKVREVEEVGELVRLGAGGRPCVFLRLWPFLDAKSDLASTTSAGSAARYEV